jgi:serine/threonine protein kinase
MSENTWERAKKIFDEASRCPIAERAGYLEEACSGDARLRTEVDALLEAHEAAGSFLGGADKKTEAGPSSQSLEGPGTTIGRYKLLQLIGEGGFGSVYMAEQEKPVRRKIALKIIKLGMDTRQVIARFEAERQALALMDHPNIARVLDAGATETGRPYFVMELVRGVPITEYCDQNNLSTKERLNLFQSVCGAVQHAHQKGIIHRDIKPSNVMVTLHDGIPVPKVIDFGIAKATNQRLTEKTLFTEYHQFIGTPQYMSPEQAEMSGLDVDTRTDIYSLGVLLYELLTGTTPFDPDRLRSMAYSEIHRVIRDEDPHKPSTRVSSLGDTVTDTAKHRATDARTLRRTLSGDIDWIVMKALEKDRTRRYETANAMLMDIRRYLDNEPVLASPPTAAYQLRKFVRRNRTAVSVFGAVGAALLIGFGVATYGFVQANRERAAARQEAEAAEAINEFFSGMLASVNPQQFNYHSPFHRVALTPDLEARFERGVSVADMLRGSTNRIDEAFQGKPLLEARARETIATTLLGLESDTEALEQFEKALERRQEVLGEGHREVLRSRILVMMTYVNGEQYVKAQEVGRAVLDDLERELGAEDPLTMFTASLFAVTLREQGDMARADSLFEITLERQRRVLGSDHRDTIRTIIGWAGAYCWRNDGPNAERLAGEAYQSVLKTYSPDDAIALEVAMQYSLALTFRNRDREAEAIARPALERAQRVLGEKHAVSLFMGFALARSLDHVENADEVAELYGRSVQERGPTTWVQARDRGMVLMLNGRVDEGLAVLRGQHEYWSGGDRSDHVRRERLGNIERWMYQHYRAALAFTKRWGEVRTLVRNQIDRRRRRAKDPESGWSDWNLYAWLLLTCEPADLRDPAEALGWATRAVEAASKINDADDVAMVHDTQARAYAMVGDFDRAVEVERIAFAKYTEAGQTRLAAYCAGQLMIYASATGENEGASKTLEQAMEEIGRIGELAPDERVNLLRLFATGLDDRGRHDLAESLHRRALEEARALPEKLPLLLASIALASSRASAGAMEEANTLLEEAPGLYRKLFVTEPIDWAPRLGYTGEGERSTDARQAKRALALAYIDLGRLEEARVLIEEVGCLSRYWARYPAARLLMAQGDPAAAEPMIRHIHFRELFWNDDADQPAIFARHEAEYGRCLAQNGKYDHAEALLLRAHARALEACGPESTHLPLITSWIEDMYRNWGKATLAAQWKAKGGGNGIRH